MKSPACFEDSETKRIIRKICDEHSIDPDLLKDLCEVENDHYGSGRRFGLREDIESALNRFISRSKE